MRRSMLSAICCVAALAFFSAGAVADTLTLRDGTVITGTYLGGGAREIRMDLGDHVQTFPVDRVSGLQFDAYVQPQPPPPQSDSSQQTQPGNDQPPPPPPPQGGNYPSNGTYASNAPPPAQGQTGPMIPAGTAITISMIDSVDSDSSNLGRTYRASIDEPVMVNGQTIIPRGANVTTKIVNNQQAGKIAGRTVIGLAIQTININGQDVPVTTSDVQQSSGSRGKRSAGVIGGGTALGAIIGGLAGGGRGAAIGAVSGAAVGTGAEVLTKGEKVHIPSETRLTFTLTNPISL